MELNEGPDAAAEGMDADEFLGWAAYLQLEPFGEQRADVHVAMLLAQQYDIHRGKKPRKKPAVFMPQWYKSPKREKRPMTIEELEYVMRRQFLAMGGTLDDLED